MKAFIAGLIIAAVGITVCTKTPRRPDKCDGSIICIWSLETGKVWYKW